MGRHVQGVLNLIDNRVQDGGFHCIPMANATAWLRDWTAVQKWSAPPEVNGRQVGVMSCCLFFSTSLTPFSTKKNRHVFTARECALLPSSRRVPCPAGTLILFDACLPHGTQPNRSGRPRAIQFLRYIPEAALSPANRKLRADAVKRHCAH